MTITCEQVKDLQPGDVVELRGYPSLKDAVVSGPLWTDGETKKLCVGPFVIRHRDGTAPKQYDDDPNFTLTVVSRAPRLYVNHPRTEPVEHDVVRDGSGVIRHCGPISASTDMTWWSWEVEPGFRWTWTSTPPQPLTLLVDGETGQVVP